MRTKLSLLLMVCLLSALTATAQEPRGAISGQVLDPNGAIIPGASVSITNLDTGQTLKITTNDAGSYAAPLLPIGRYRLEAEQSGFKKYVQNEVGVRVGDRLRIDIKLELGQVTESVTVTEGAPLLQMADASMGQVVDSTRVSDLPIAHGNPYHLIALSPGTSFEGDPKLNRPYDPTHIVAFAMDGTRANTSDITLDGVANTALASSNSSNTSVTAAYVPPSDAVAEFKVQTATFDAKVGQTSGGLVNIVLKSGTNTPHGTVYYNHRSPSLMANDFFANRSGIPMADFTYKRFGGSLTAPVYIPKVYDGHNKTFMMAAFERIHDITPRGQNPFTVPTDMMRQGNFSELSALSSKYLIYDPYSRVAGPTSGRYTETAFLNNTIPSNMINPVAKAVLGYVPKPLVDGTADHLNNYPVPTTPEDNKYYTLVSRVDHYISERHQIFLRGDVNNRHATSKDWFNTAATGQAQDYGARGGSFEDMYSFSPSLILNSRYGFTRYVRLTAPKAGRGFDITTLGFPTALNNAIDPALREFPYFNIANGFSTNNIGEDRNMDTHTVATGLTHMRGNHRLEAGFEFRAYRQNRYVLSTQSSGYYDFDQTFTKGPLDNATAAPAGQGFASFLLGIADTKSLLQRNTSMAEQSTAWMFYLQDNWRLSRSVTVTLGLRYENEGPLTERFNRSVTGLDTATLWPQSAAVSAAYATINAADPTPELPSLNAKGGLQFAGVGGQPRTLWNRDGNNLAPRIGLAYSADAKTVVRAGFGMFFSPLGARRTDVLQSGFSRKTLLVPTTNNLPPYTTLSNPFPNGILEPLGNAAGLQTEPNTDLIFFNQNIQAPYMERWQFSVQRQLPKDTVLEVAYVGNRGVKLETETATPSTSNQTSVSVYRDLNALPVQYLSTSMTKDAANTASNNYVTKNMTNPFYGIAGFGTLSTNKTIARSQLLSAFPQFGKVQTTVNQGASWYHAMQVRFEKRMAKDFTLNLGYTWSKYMEALDYMNAGDLMPSRALSQQDHPHKLVASWIYKLPFGRGQALASGVNRALDAVIGGWQLQGVYTYQTGAPLTWLDSSFYGNPADIAANLRNPDKWFNTGAGFLTNSSSKPSNHLRTWPLRFSSVRNDGINNWDLSGMKNISITEALRISLRGEFLNALNHVRFKAPVTDPYNSAFGQVTDTANNARIVQFAIKAVF